MTKEFDELFPSLKGKVFQHTCPSTLNSVIFIKKDDVQKHCLDKNRVREVISNIKPKKWKENNRCFTNKELEVYTKSSHQFDESMAIFVLSEIERYIERIERELNLENKE